MATAKRKSKELREVDQQRKILAASIALSYSLEDIAKKHKLSATDVVEIVKKSFDSCLIYVLNKSRRI